jgi:protein transport protein SEC31
MVTCSDDDQSPVILVWDLRNASAAEMTLSGHSKGILSMDWCPKDSDLLLSCGKDNRTIVWNTTSGQPIGDLVHSGNWSFDTQWCPRNPDLCVVASYDGLVSVHSIQGSRTNMEEDDVFSPVPQQASPDGEQIDPFSAIALQDHRPSRIQQPVFKLQQPPKWLRKPVGAVWGFGGQLVTFGTTTGTAVSIKQFPINEEIAFRTDQLEYILKEENPETTAQYCDYMAHAEFIRDPKEKEIWQFLKTLFSANSKDDMIDFLGFDPSFQSNERLATLMKKLNVGVKTQPNTEEVDEKDVEKKTESSLPFQLFSTRQTEDSDTDTLITKAAIIGDFELAVSICLGANRIADALVFAVNGGPELLQKTQEEYFKKSMKTKPYARVLQSIVQNDLTDIVANTKLEGDSWKDLVALICTYARHEDYGNYFSTLGNRLSGISTFSHAASLCFVGSGEFEKVVHSWCPDQGKEDSHVENIPLLGLVERLAVFRQAVRYVDSSLALEHAEDSFGLSDLYNAYAEYAWIAASHGKVEAAWRFLEQVPIDFIPTVSIPVDIFVLRDQVYSNKNLTLAITGRPPAFPFEIMDVIDYEGQRRAEKARQEQMVRQAQAKQTFQPTTSTYGGYQQQQNQGYPPSYQQPAVNQWQQPSPAVNQWNQNQPSTAWNASSIHAPPSGNTWTSSAPAVPQPVQTFSPPPITNWNNPQGPAPLVPQTSQPFIPPPPQKSWDALPPAGVTGHAPPIPSTHFQPPPVNAVQSTPYLPTQTFSHNLNNPIPPPPVPAEPAKPGI